MTITFLTKGRTQRKWLYTKNTTVSGIQKPMNEYFYHNSHNILGNLEIIDMYDRKGLTCKRRGDVHQLLKRVLTSVRQNRLITMTNALASLDLQIKSLQATQQALAAKCSDLLFFPT